MPQSLPFQRWDHRAHNNKLDCIVLDNMKSHDTQPPTSSSIATSSSIDTSADFSNLDLLNSEIMRMMASESEEVTPAMKKKLRTLFEIINQGPKEGNNADSRIFETIKKVAKVSEQKASNAEDTVKLMLHFVNE